MAENKVPEIIVDASDYQEVIKKLDLIDETIELTHSASHQIVGKRLGRDIGILYGMCIGLILVVIYLLIVTTLGLTPATTVQLQEGESLLSAVIRILL